MTVQGLRLLLVALVALPAHAAERAHEHGRGRLDVAVEGSRVTLRFEAPLQDLAGFEREPRNEKERAALDSVRSYLASGRAFAPAAAGGCNAPAAAVEITSSGKGHAEVHATWTYECADPARLTIEAGIFTQFRSLQRIDVRAVTPKGQSGTRLTASRRKLELSSQ